MSFAGQRGVITGKFIGLPRATLKNRIEEAGGIVTGRVSDRTGFLLAGIRPAEKKLAKANELGVAVVALDSACNLKALALPRVA